MFYNKVEAMRKSHLVQLLAKTHGRQKHGEPTLENCKAPEATNANLYGKKSRWMQQKHPAKPSGTAILLFLSKGVTPTHKAGRLPAWGKLRTRSKIERGGDCMSPLPLKCAS